MQSEYLGRFEVDHLISMTGLPNRPVDVEMALKRLQAKDLRPENYVLRCVIALVVRMNRKEIVIINQYTGEEMETFPVRHVSKALARQSLDPHEIYNNKVILILSKSFCNNNDNAAAAAGGAGPPPHPGSLLDAPEIHIFQALKVSASEIVNKIERFFTLKINNDSAMEINEEDFETEVDEKMRSRRETPRSMTSAIAQDVLRSRKRTALVPFTNNGAGGGGGGGLIQDRSFSDMDPAGIPLPPQDVASRIERETYLVNRCFEDVEKFMERLYRSVKSYELMKSKLSKLKSIKQNRQNKISESLASRAHLPRKEEFIECYKLVKLSFILLSRLNGYVHNPNPVDIVHSLFRILEVVVNASRDPNNNKEPQLARRVVSPLLSKTAIEFLNTCLDSREKHLWQELGEAWYTCRQDWQHGFVPHYVPTFSDGFTPTLWDYDGEIFNEGATNGNVLARFGESSSQYDDQITSRSRNRGSFETNFY